MSYTQHITYGYGGTVDLYLIDRPTSVTARVITGSGSELVAATNATISSINTTTAAAISRGDLSVTLSNASAIAVGDRFWVRSPDEELRCKSKSGNVVTLWSPALAPHSNAVAAEGTRVSYVVTSGQASETFWDGRIEWVVDGTSVRHTSVVCTKYPFYRAATQTDLVDEEPHIEQLLSDETDADRLLDIALEDVLKRIGKVQHPWVYTGPEMFAQATVFAALMRRYRSQSGESAKELYERYRDNLADEIGMITQQSPVDLDQDSAVEESEKRSYRSINVYRR